MKIDVFNQKELPHYRRVRCSEQLPTTFPPGTRWMQCKASARWRLNDKPYCTNHAGRHALSHLLEANK